MSLRSVNKYCNNVIHNLQVLLNEGLEPVGWKLGPDLPEALCCAGQFNVYFENLFMVGGTTQNGEFLVKVMFTVFYNLTQT